jgi:hypothetical protein
MGLSLEQQVVLFREQVAQLLAINTQLRQQIDQLQLHVAKLVKMTFGRASERVEGPTLFDDLLDDPEGALEPDTDDTRNRDQVVAQAHALAVLSGRRGVLL